MNEAQATVRGVLLAASHSGAGKTTVTLALLRALVRRGLVVQAMKCGPDFIDPTLHRMVTGRPSANLDLRMCGPDYVRTCFARQLRQADIALVEGVMGLFDGGLASPAALAKHLRLPVVLVVDAKGSGESLAAVVKGFESLDPDLPLLGVIANRVGSARHLQLVRGAITAHCRTPLLGHLPRQADFVIADRHLGLRMGMESPLTTAQLDLLADSVAAHVDLDRLLAGALIPRPTDSPGPQTTSPPPRRARIGVAQDEAFCFYYQDNLDILRAAGAELVPFSPLRDQALPPGLHGLYLGGGYPELHGQALSANRSMREAIRAWSLANRPLYAECGGFLYLCQGVRGQDGSYWPLAGVFPTQARMRPRLASLGYREATIERPCLLGSQGRLFGHEFHYSEIEPMPESVPRAFRLADGRLEGYQLGHTLAGYLHLHFGQTPEAARHFVDLCAAGATTQPY